jgi:pyrimidine-nucleoside phosphorylase
MSSPLAPLELLERSRRGEPVDRESVANFVRMWAGGGATDAQMAAWCMTATHAEIDPAATAALMAELIATGDRLQLSAFGPTGDVQSVGGVGDSSPLVAIPIAAALGVRIASVGARGMGHTGGILDQLAAIPGYQTDLHLADFVRQVKDVGCAVIGPSDRMVPATKRLDALREQTATTTGMGLIAASTMARTLAAGVAATVVVVGVGSGSLCASASDAARVIGLMAELAEPWARELRVVVVDLDQPLGIGVGHALQVRQAATVLRGEGPADLREVGIRVAGDLAEAAGVAEPGQGRACAEEAIADGTALAMAERWVEAQGGEPAVWTDDDALPAAPIRLDVVAPCDGWLAALPARAIGEAARRLGAGRLHPQQHIDPAVGIELRATRGDAVAEGEPVMVIHARDAALGEECVVDLANRIVVSEVAIDPRPLILDLGVN